MNYTSLYRKITSLHSLIPYHFFKGGYAFPPLNVFFELTYRCNLRCAMCQFLPMIEDPLLSAKSKDMELSTEEIKGIIEQVPPYALLTFTGGEPLLRKDIFDILRFASVRNKCHLITNGTLLKEEEAKFLTEIACKNIAAKGLLMVGISLEGDREVHNDITAVPGSFDKTLNAVKLLSSFKKQRKQKYPLINIATVMQRGNIKNLSRLIDIAESANADILSFLTYSRFPHFERLESKYDMKKNTSVKEEDRFDTVELQKEILDITKAGRGRSMQIRFSPHSVPPEGLFRFYDNMADIRDYICYSPWTKALISSQGELMPCSNYIAGSLREKGFYDLWNGERMRAFRKRIRKRGLEERCLGCCMIERKG